MDVVKSNNKRVLFMKEKNQIVLNLIESYEVEFKNIEQTVFKKTSDLIIKGTLKGDEAQDKLRKKLHKQHKMSQIIKKQ